MDSAVTNKVEGTDAVPGEYSSSHERAVDKGRVSLPPEWRKDHWPIRYALLPWPLINPRCLLALPPAEWERVSKAVSSKMSDPRRSGFERLLQTSVTHRTLDDYGRLPLPESAISLFKYGQHATLVGMNSRFEIWNPDHLQGANQELSPETVAQMSANLNL